jgi:hypothetical protein
MQARKAHAQADEMSPRPDGQMGNQQPSCYFRRYIRHMTEKAPDEEGPAPSGKRKISTAVWGYLPNISTGYVKTFKKI